MSLSNLAHFKVHFLAVTMNIRLLVLIKIWEKKRRGGRRGGFSTLKIQCSITFITLISFKTLTTDTSVSFGCKPYLTQKVLSRATATVTKILGMKKKRCTFVSLFNFKQLQLPLTSSNWLTDFIWWHFQSIQYILITRDDVVSQRYKFGCAFFSYFSRESKIAVFFLTFPYPVPSRKIVWFLLAATSNHVQVRLSKDVIFHEKKIFTRFCLTCLQNSFFNFW